MTEVRPATTADLAAITAIYNHWITETHVSFDAEPQTIDDRTQWFRHYAETGRYRVLVAERNGEVEGVTYSSRFRPKASYDTTVETTVVVHPAALGFGTGKLLLSELIKTLETEDVHRAVALIALPNQPSIDLHEQLDYRTVGIHDEVGRKFGRFWSVQIMERAFS